MVTNAVDPHAGATTAQPRTPGVPSVDDGFDEAQRRRRAGTWMTVGATAAVVVFAAAILLRVRGRHREPARRGLGRIDWRLTLFSNNTMEFKPSLALSPRAHR